PWPLADLLTLFWDVFFDKEDTDKKKDDSDYVRKYALRPWLKPNQGTNLPALLILSHGEISGAEKSDLEKVSPLWEHLRSATAFGYDLGEIDKWALQDARHDLIETALGACQDPIDERADFVEEASHKLAMALGDTQWPINEITLWDFSSSIAALFKSGVARSVLEGEIPSVGDMRWRFLSIRFDGLSYFSQVHHITDLIGRREAVEVALNAAQKLLEETYPLGNEVYRDENGAVFVVPDLSEQENILSLTNRDGTTLETLLNQAFAGLVEDDGAALAGELVPHISMGAAKKGKQLQLGKYLQETSLPLDTDPDKMDTWWSGKQAKNKEICTVCGVRPVGYKPKGAQMPGWVKSIKAEDRHVCCVCLHRRGRRARDWLQKKPSTTIWTDEVVDINGRFALLVGQFDLANWLDGTLIGTMHKPASFARVRRCWETTYNFWNDVKENLIADENEEKQPRLALKPKNSADLHLGRYHAYELQVGGQGINVVWDPLGEELILTEQLHALGKRLGFSEDEDIVCRLSEWFENCNDENGWTLYEPHGYGSSPKKSGQKIFMQFVHGDVCGYTPNIALVSEPSLFMTIIPADKAMKVVNAIKQKYEREMSKVQDRLPLHLGMVIAKRRTPLRAVLDAGRAMLEKTETAQKWECCKVTDVQKKDTLPADETLNYLAKDNQHFEQWWNVKLECDHRVIPMRVAGVMGDGHTPDQWHAHFLTREPLPHDKFDDEPWIRHDDLKAGDEVYITPSTFDFEYLDTTARRFEIAYDENGQRRGRPTRPYYLAEIEDIQKVWGIISTQMSSTQWMRVSDLIERKRRAWQEPRGFTGEYSETFRQFISDRIHNIKWKQKQKLEKAEDWMLLEQAALHGMLDDIIDLYHEALKEPEEA
ncbi:MAG: hypothetical protein U9Q82_04560, partial [Chloroflexota bacterium]|nr:hypothetical protein [Chloroflexota bacterium]